jgi:transposase
MRAIAAPKKFSDELRERATRVAIELRDDPESRSSAIPRVARQLELHSETLRNWVRHAEVDEGRRKGTSTSDAQRLADLGRVPPGGVNRVLDRDGRSVAEREGATA